MTKNLPRTTGDTLMVQTLTGETVRYVNLDNTATTPAFHEVCEAVNEFATYYGSIHRGSGYKSYFSTWLYEQARARIGEFVGIDPGYHQILFSANSTTAINKAARILRLSKMDEILVSAIEHSSNDLPWRQCATIRRFQVNDDNTIDLASIESELKRPGSRVKIIAVSGASNVTGYVPPVHEVARIAHSFGVPVFIDCAQLAPHRRISMGMESDPEHLDFVSFSGHKMGAPYGAGVLVCPSKYLSSSDLPSDEPGGGTAELVTDEEVFWSPSPERYEAGTPNALGVIALAKAVEVITHVGWDCIRQHETDLWRRACQGLKRIPGIELYVDPDKSLDHTPVLPFNLPGYPHGIVAAILGFEYGIGVRHGRHCADNLILRLLRYSREKRDKAIREAIDNRRTTRIYGVVRPSIGICNRDEDIDRLIEAVHRIAVGGTKFEYECELSPTDGCSIRRETGEFIPKGFSVSDLIALGNPGGALMGIARPTVSP
jgi:cysteine desulfurase / selenocysteine lyase